MAIPATPVDQDKLVDPVARDDHARKLVGEKARRDRDSFLALARAALSVKETVAALAGTLVVLAALVALLIALSA